MERIKAILNSSASARWLFYGDSITHGASHTLGWRDFSEHFRERVLWELRRGGDMVLNSAYNGFTTVELLRDFDWRVAAFRPTVAFVMIGTNDSGHGMPPEEFSQRLDELLDRFAALNCLTVLQTPIPILRDLAPRCRTLPLLAESMRKVAARRGVPLIDHFDSWSNDPAKFYLYADEYHPNAEGHIKIAHDIFRALGIFDPEKSNVCRFFRPCWQ